MGNLDPDWCPVEPQPTACGGAKHRAPITGYNHIGCKLGLALLKGLDAVIPFLLFRVNLCLWF